MALKLWAAFSLYGVNGLGGLIDEAFAKASLLASKLKAQPDFSLLMPPQTNIVCFRYLAKLEGEALNQHQTDIRQQLVESGLFHITQAKVEAVIWLRVTLMNPFTTESDLDALLASIAQTSKSLLSK